MQPNDWAHKRGLNTKLHLAVADNGIPVRAILTAGNVHDCVMAEKLFDGIKAKRLLADRGYDSDKIVRKARLQGMEAVIPPKKNRKVQREYDKTAYKERHIVENVFMRLKRWREIATRYCKNAQSFVSAINICCCILFLIK
jgi:transposase